MKIGIAHGNGADVDAIRRVLALAPRHRVAWVARNAADALALCAQDRPELLLLDLFLPELGAAQASRHILAAAPCAILVLAREPGQNAAQIFEAMGAGALDAIDTPRAGAGRGGREAVPLLVKLDALERRLAQRDHDARAAGAAGAAARALVAIGASAGGPAALRTVLGGLPPDFGAAVVIVQHMDQRFAPGLADWLGQYSALPVRACREGEAPAAGVVLLASSNDHLCLGGGGRLGYTAEPADYVYRPSVDVFFHSVAARWGGRAVGVLLTGMGRDGARGLKALRDKGHPTIAQDRASCAVYGMPKAAVECGAAVEVVAADRIAERLVTLLSQPIHGGAHA